MDSSRPQPAAWQPASALADRLARAGRGDLAAFESVYDEVCGPVLGLVRRVLRDRGEAEEVTQEVMLDVWRFAPRFDPGRGSALSWVFTLAHRRAVDRVRSSQRTAARDRRLPTLPEAYDEVADQVEIRLEHEQVRRCLGHLTELQREAVFLAYYGGYTYAEVATLLGVPTGTVKTRMRDGLIRLRDCLGVDE